ncbi:hypothetical protein R3P38DRAFT_3351269 [Favolaschia claudopus]|uniref:Uncharacterized protein n=1 Tax=Favolaschia claudopus TaxID=2862362 RepID=A0AAW0CAT7_9AGAR
MPKCREVTSELHIRSTYTADDLARPLPPTTTTSPGSTSTPSPSLSSRTTTLAVVVAVAVAFLHSFNRLYLRPACTTPRATYTFSPPAAVVSAPANAPQLVEVGEKIKTATPLLFASPLSSSLLNEQVSERRSKGSPPVNWRSCSRTGVPSRAVFHT